MFYRMFAFVALLGLLFISPQPAYAQNGEWYYPMTDYQKRIIVKDFGTLINSEFYQGKETLFPGMKLYGYHAAVDLDAFDSEQNTDVPVYAVANGTILYSSPNVGGYGGVIIQSLDGTSDTALYGHVKQGSMKVGNRVVGGQQITSLGNRFSQETSGERKHLHFAIHKGSDLYFRGHEDNLSQLTARWQNPTAYLSEQNAQSPNAPLSLSPDETSPSQPSNTPHQSLAIQSTESVSFWQKITNWLRRLFSDAK
jgi:murein DD-endopeptidase MepM/ murein hydrolase activator NlpD